MSDKSRVRRSEIRWRLVAQACTTGLAPVGAVMPQCTPVFGSRPGGVKGESYSSAVRRASGESRKGMWSYSRKNCCLGGNGKNWTLPARSVASTGCSTGVAGTGVPAIPNHECVGRAVALRCRRRTAWIATSTPIGYAEWGGLSPAHTRWNPEPSPVEPNEQVAWPCGLTVPIEIPLQTLS